MNSVELEHIATKKRKLHETSGNSNKEHKFKALLSDNKYRIRVRSVNMMGNSEWTDWKLTTTKKRDVPIVKIPTPMNLETETIVNDSKSFHLKWSSNNKRKKKQKNQKNINNKNKQTNDGTQEKNNIQYYIHLDCDDGVGFHQVEIVQHGKCETIVRNVTSTTGIVKCRVQASNVKTGHRSPFSATVQVQMFSLRARQRRKSNDVNTKEEAQSRAKDAAVRMENQNKMVNSKQNHLKLLNWHCKTNSLGYDGKEEHGKHFQLLQWLCC